MEAEKDPSPSIADINRAINSAGTKEDRTLLTKVLTGAGIDVQIIGIQLGKF